MVTGPSGMMAPDGVTVPQHHAGLRSTPGGGANDAATLIFTTGDEDDHYSTGVVGVAARWNCLRKSRGEGYDRVS